MLKADHSIDALSSQREIDAASHIESIRERNFPGYSRASAKKFSQISKGRPKFDAEYKTALHQFITNNTKTPEEMRDVLSFIDDMNISTLENLPYKQKQEIAEFMMGLWLAGDIKDIFGEYMLVWVQSYVQHNTWQKEQISDYLINYTSYIGSDKNRIELNKVLDYWSNTGTATDAVLGKEMLQDMPKYMQNIDSPNLKDGMSLRALTTYHATSMHEVNRFNKSFDQEGNSIDALVRRIDRLDNKDNLHILKKNAVRKNWEGTEYDIYLDAPIGIGLFYQGKPIAVLSYTIQSNHIYIKQFQVVAPLHYDRHGRSLGSKAPKIIQNIDRQNILYTVFIDFCKQYDCHEIIIQSAENNRWVKEKQRTIDYNSYLQRRETKSTEKSHLSLHIAQEIYDAFASTHGFQKNEITKNREKNIE